MSITSKISALKRSLLYVLGIVVAAFVVSQEVIDFHCDQVNAEIEATTDDGQATDDSSDDQQSAVYEYTCELALPSAAIQLEAFVPVFIYDVVRQSNEIEQTYPVVPLYDSPLYKNLFRQIISPNAP